MGKHPRLAAAVLGLPASLRQRAALRIDHCLDLRSSLLVVALKGISNDHVSSRWFLAITRSRSTPVRCARLAIRDRVDHAATPQRVGESLFDRTAATRSAHAAAI